MAWGEKVVQKKKKKSIVKALTPVTLRRVGQMVSAFDGELNIQCFLSVFCKDLKEFHVQFMFVYISFHILNLYRM